MCTGMFVNHEDPWPPCHFVAFVGFSFSFNVGGRRGDYRQRQALWQILVLEGSGGENFENQI